MLQLDAPAGVRVLTTATGAAQLVDVSCGTCATCQSGAVLWCTSPVEDGDAVFEIPNSSANFVSSLLALAAIDAAATNPDDVVVALADEAPDVLAQLLQLIHSGTVLATTDLKDPALLETLATLRPNGRADLIVTLGSPRDAVRAVSRGGTVCMPGTTTTDVSVTELVQREVRLVGPKNLRSVIDRTGRKSVEHQFDVA